MNDSVTTFSIFGSLFGLPILLSYLSTSSQKRRKPAAFVKKIMFYPLKSCAGVAVGEAVVQPFGLECEGILDRSFCIYQCQERCIRILSLKVHGSLAKVKPRVQYVKIVISYPGMTDFILECEEEVYRNRPEIAVRMGSDNQTLVDCGEDAAKWITKALGLPGSRIGYSGFFYRERMTKIYDEQDTLYGDQSLSWLTTPMHIVSQASLNDLSGKCGLELPDCQFRQPILVDGCCAFEEDAWKDVQIGNAHLYTIMLGERCQLITTNPETGEKNVGMEPLKTLKKYRVVDGYAHGPCFGIKLGVHTPGRRVRLGDAVLVTTKDSLT